MCICVCVCVHVCVHLVLYVILVTLFMGMGQLIGLVKVNEVNNNVGIELKYFGLRLFH